MSDFEIEALLQKAMGLKVTSIGKTTLDRSIQSRMKALFMQDKEAYVEKLQSSALELKELIEEVVIPETWFFRDKEPFNILNQFLVTKWLPKHKNNMLRLLSVPCSTGEEPYSITMSLLSSGWSEDKFTVHAIDISRRSLERAKNAVYTEHSFRGVDQVFKSQYFKKVNKSYLLNKSVRKKVHFRNGNILNPLFMEGLGVFDVIFCRNVLIYFDALSRHQAIKTLSQLLSDDGILFVGHAESQLFSNSPFIRAQFPQAFAFYKKPAETKSPQIDSSVPGKSTSKTPGPKHLYPFQRSKPSSKAKPNLTLARQLADKGQLAEATRICEDHLDQFGPSAQAFFLLGIIYDADDDTNQAEKLFRKAIYLDPNHEESLVFLSLLAERQGDSNEAKTLKQRLNRLKVK
jgi:chemotaxis protein methyltransferase WspC